MGNMEIALVIANSILLITLVLLQSGKAEGASSSLTGGLDLFTERKERGVEKVITRLTFALGFLFFVTTFVLSYVV